MKVSTGISIEAEIMRNGKARATKLRRTFSNYVEGLIMEDIGKQPVITDSHHNIVSSKIKRRAKA